ncbi:MAG: ATP-binding protein [Thermodesulfobacteriota bacterium]|nr:MAG: ATP-binding protein [Thermodesulfobacteriota bacterium]
MVGFFNILKPDTNLDPQERLRRRRERLIILIIAVLIAGLTVLESYFSRASGKLPLSSNILVYSILNLNIILLVLLIFLVIRNVVKLIFERRHGILGSKIRTKLVASFIGLTIVPTLLLFWAAASFITNTLDNLISFQVEQSLEESLEVAQKYYQNLKDSSLFFAHQLSTTISERGLLSPDEKTRLQKFIENKSQEYNVGAIEILSPSHPFQKSLAIASHLDLDDNIYYKIDRELIKEGVLTKDIAKIQSLHKGELIRGISPIFSDTVPAQVDGFIVVSYYIPNSLVKKMTKISNRFTDYKRLTFTQPPLKQTYIILLSSITLLLFFSAIMFGFHLAKNITGPIKELAEGTLEVAKGNLDVRIAIKADDEIGSLVESFNKMTQDLKTGKDQLELTYTDLHDTNIELDKRRTYMEIVLKNVAAGVVSIDHDGRITTINKSVGKILGLDVESCLNKRYHEILPPHYLRQVDDLIQEVDRSSSLTFEKEIKLALSTKVIDLSTFITPLKDEKGNYLGLVIVIEDVTELQKGQRIAAWREVARRIAHEIKNPLTPIQLSAQRLRRRYKDKFLEDGQIFDECTHTIITQVELLKNMVNEFSNFARIPATKPSPNYLPQIINETLPIFREAHKNITFTFDESEAPPLMNLDSNQIKRALINILENAVGAIAKDGEVTITTFHDKRLKIAGVEIADNGCGIPPEEKSRLFEPYFSTKKSGTGLGLAIVESIISDHQGHIRVKDNYPKGTIFRIALPTNI